MSLLERLQSTAMRSKPGFVLSPNALTRTVRGIYLINPNGKYYKPNEGMLLRHAIRGEKIF